MNAPISPQHLSIDQLAALEEIARRRLQETRIEDYRPYPKQRLFHEHGASYRERLFMAGNQLGKTMAGAAEYAYHMTGRYPDWWKGRMFRGPITGWAAGVTSELTRDGCQRLLLGRPKMLGTGMIPKDAILDYSTRRGVADAIDTVWVKHGGGGDVQAGTSQFTLKSYDQGVTKFQSETLHLVWLDEEPDLTIYTEALTRTNTTGGMVYMTFTPMLGMSDTVMRFLMPEENDAGRSARVVVQMGIAEAEHYTEAERETIIASYPAHERQARANGNPVLGSGRVFPIEVEAIKVRAIPIPDHWPRIAAMDFGWTHPTAVVWLAWDRDADVVYVTDIHRLREQPVPVHASAIKARGDWIPVAWPHDGENETAQGPQLAQQYRDEGVAMRPENAKFPEPSDDKQVNSKQSRVSVEAGVQEMLTRMLEGRLKVFEHLGDWFEEFGLYHRKDGKIVKLKDDLLSATRYGIMDLRFAQTRPAPRKLAVNRRLNWRA